MKNTAATSRPPRFDKQWSETIAANLLATDAELLTNAIRRYQLDGTLPDLPPLLMVAFGFLRPTIDRRAVPVKRRVNAVCASSRLQPRLLR